MEMIAGADKSIGKAKELLKIKRKLTGAEWIKLIDKNPEAFKISKEHLSRINSLIRKSDIIFAKDFNDDNTMKSGRPKAEKTDEIFAFINEKLNSDWTQIKALKSEIMTKFGITAGRVESEYTKYSELNGDFIIREYIKPNGWCIKAKGRIENKSIIEENEKVEEQFITLEDVPFENDKSKMQNEEDPWV
jgi:hypothetical protein